MGEDRDMPLREPVDRHATHHRRPVAALPLQTAYRRHTAAHRTGRHAAAKREYRGRGRSAGIAETASTGERNCLAGSPLPLREHRLHAHPVGPGQGVCHTGGPHRLEKFAHRPTVEPTARRRHHPEHHGATARHDRDRLPAPHSTGVYRWANWPCRRFTMPCRCAPPFNNSTPR